MVNKKWVNAAQYLFHKLKGFAWVLSICYCAIYIHICVNITFGGDIDFDVGLHSNVTGLFFSNIIPFSNYNLKQSHSATIKRIQ